jgi:hypothetical protein
MCGRNAAVNTIPPPCGEVGALQARRVGGLVVSERGDIQTKSRSPRIARPHATDCPHPDAAKWRRRTSPQGGGMKRQVRLLGAPLWARSREPRATSPAVIP